MSDLIDREALLRQIDIDSEGEPGYYGDTWKFIDTIKSMPSALGTNLAEVGTDAISRNSAIEIVEKYFEKIGLNGDICIDGLRQLPPIQPKLLQPWEVLVAQAVLSQPAEPKRGKWIEDKGQQTLMQNFIERGEVWRVCSVCGAGHMIGHKYECDKAYHETHHNFCPNCGAKMEVTI